MPGDSGNGTVVENHNNQLNAGNGPLGGLERAASMDAKSAEAAKRSPRSRALLGTIQRQASLPAAPNSPVLGNSSTNSHSRLNPSNKDKLLKDPLAIAQFHSVSTEDGGPIAPREKLTSPY